MAATIGNEARRRGNGRNTTANVMMTISWRWWLHGEIRSLLITLLASLLPLLQQLLALRLLPLSSSSHKLLLLRFLLSVVFVAGETQDDNDDDDDGNGIWGADIFLLFISAIFLFSPFILDAIMLVLMMMIMMGWWG